MMCLSRGGVLSVLLWQAGRVRSLWSDGDEDHGFRSVVDDKLADAFDGQSIDAIVDFLECDEASQQVHIASQRAGSGADEFS